MYNSVCADIDFQIVGHIGYIARYAPFEQKILTRSEFATEIDRILSVIIERNLAIELNTSVSGLDIPFVPYRDIIERYIALGGKNFTFGSDAHKAADYARGSAAVKDFLRSLGLNYTLRYENEAAIKEYF